MKSIVTTSDLSNILSFPYYVFSGDTCTKYYKSDDISFSSIYKTTDTECNCLSHMKGYFCKHLCMKSGQYGFLSGASDYVVKKVVEEILEKLSGWFDVDVDFSNVPLEAEYVKLQSSQFAFEKAVYIYVGLSQKFAIELCGHTN